jgi:hypothetical protein
MPTQEQSHRSLSTEKPNHQIYDILSGFQSSAKMSFINKQLGNLMDGQAGDILSPTVAYH